MVDQRCNAGSPTVERDGEMRSYTCTLPAWHDSYHENGFVTWRDPEPVLGEPKPWHPGHKAHADE